MKNIIKYWPILKYDLLSGLKTILLITIGLAILWGFFWVVVALGIETIILIAAYVFIAFMIVTVTYMYFKDLPDRLERKKFFEDPEASRKAYEERQRNAEH